MCHAYLNSQHPEGVGLPESNPVRGSRCPRGPRRKSARGGDQGRGSREADQGARAAATRPQPRTGAGQRRHRKSEGGKADHRLDRRLRRRLQRRALQAQDRRLHPSRRALLCERRSEPQHQPVSIPARAPRHSGNGVPLFRLSPRARLCRLFVHALRRLCRLHTSPVGEAAGR